MGRGALASYRFPAAGYFGLGFAYHDWKSPRIQLPSLGEYRIRGWKEYAFDWVSGARLLRIRFGLETQEDGDPSKGPNRKGQFGLIQWEAELRPVNWFAVKAERTFLVENSNVGVILHLPRKLVLCDGRMEVNIAHSRFGAGAIPSPLREILLLEKGHDNGLGYILGFSLGAGI